MTNLDYNDDTNVILNLIEDTIGALADSVALLVGEFLALIGTGIISKHLDSLQDSPNVLLRDGAEVLRNGLLEQKSISCHVPSSL